MADDLESLDPGAPFLAHMLAGKTNYSLNVNDKFSEKGGFLVRLPALNSPLTPLTVTSQTLWFHQAR